MSNNLRIEVAGAYYHVNANALDGMQLFRDEGDRIMFLELLASERLRSSWTILAYTLMTTHYHLLMKLNELTLSSGFQHLHSAYARIYNRRHGRRGVVWQKRFHDELIDSDSHLLEVVRYVALNAPRAQMCDAPEAWSWCSYGASIGRYAADPLVDDDELLGLFGGSTREARRRLQRFVGERDPRERRRQTRVRRRSDAEQ
jgi:REP element-mobilizing transposase RayT